MIPPKLSLEELPPYLPSFPTLRACRLIMIHVKI